MVYKPTMTTQKLSCEIPPLPVEKDYHVFVCYPSENVQVVHTIVQNLEKEGLKCCYHERDFTPGTRVLENVHETMMKSMHMLVVVSDDFNKRGFCTHEVLQGLHAKINEDFSIIPIKIEPCTVPVFLKHITYIDAEDVPAEEMHPLILDAILKRGNRSDLTIGSNGHVLTIPVTRSKPPPTWFSLTRYSFNLDLETRQKIWSQQFQLSVKQLDELEVLISSSPLVKFGHILNYFKCITASMFTIVGLLAALVCGVVSIACMGQTNASSLQCSNFTIIVINFLVFGIPCLYCTCICGTCCLCKKQCISLHNPTLRKYIWLEDDLWRFNKHSMNLKLIIMAELIPPSGCVKIMRYDFRACQEYFGRRCERKVHLQSDLKDGESLENYTRRKFGELLKSRRIRQLFEINISQTERHRMVNGGKCICLCVEEYLDSVSEYNAKRTVRD